MCLKYYIGFTPCTWITSPYGTRLSTWECSVPLQNPWLQLPFNFVIFQKLYHCHCMMKWKYDIRVPCNSQRIEWALCHWCDGLICLASRKGIIPLSCTTTTWQWCTRQRISSLLFIEFLRFHFSFPLVKWIEYMQSVIATDLTLRVEKQNNFYPFQLFGDTRDSWNLENVASRGPFKEAYELFEYEK
jgi:hypothetical protein